MTLLSLKLTELLLLPILERHLYIRQKMVHYNNMIVLQSAVNDATFEILYTALTVSKAQLNLGCVSCR